MRATILATGALGLALAAGQVAWAQETPPAGAQSPPAPAGNYVTREEYDKLRSEMQSVQKELAGIKADRAARQAEVDQTFDEIQRDISTNRGLINELHLGTNRFTIAGDAEAGFTTVRKEPSSFDATFAPLFLWQLSDRLLFEGALDISGSTDPDTQTSSTDVTLTLANISYLVNDYVYVGGGLFAVPFAQYHWRFDPPWINPLPDDPLVFGDRAIAPSSETGAFVGGGIPAGGTRIEYNVYVANGPTLITNDPDAAGSLNFDDFTDLNNNKAVGGRIGWVPVPEFDVGYSIQYSKPGSSGFNDVYAVLQAVDAIYRKELEPILGTLTVRGEWVFTNVTKATYDPTGELGFGPLTFDNDRNGGYVLASYRPTRVSNKILKNTEFVGRYDIIDVSSDAPGGGEENRWTFGLDYWLTSSVVLKTAYQIDSKQVGPDQNAFFVQCGIGL
jgi:hypothetical protein